MLPLSHRLRASPRKRQRQSCSPSPGHLAQLYARRSLLAIGVASLGCMLLLQRRDRDKSCLLVCRYTKFPCAGCRAVRSFSLVDAISFARSQRRRLPANQCRFFPRVSRTSLRTCALATPATFGASSLATSCSASSLRTSPRRRTASTLLGAPSFVFHETKRSFRNSSLTINSGARATASAVAVCASRLKPCAPADAILLSARRLMARASAPSQALPRTILQSQPRSPLLVRASLVRSQILPPPLRCSPPPDHTLPVVETPPLVGVLAAPSMERYHRQLRVVVPRPFLHNLLFPRPADRVPALTSILHGSAASPMSNNINDSLLNYLYYNCSKRLLYTFVK